MDNNNNWFDILCKNADTINNNFIDVYKDIRGMEKKIKRTNEKLFWVQAAIVVGYFGYSALEKRVRSIEAKLLATDVEKEMPDNLV